MKVINLYAGPSARKTTTASGLFHYMKTRHINCEMAPEYAKELVWDRNFETLDDQIHIFGEQHRRLYRLLGKVDFAITDCPLLLSLVYGQTACKHFKKRWLDSFRNLVDTVYDQYDNIDYFLNRGDEPFIQHGRIQNFEESKVKDKEIKDLLKFLNIDYKEVYNLTEIIEDLKCRKLL